MTKKQYSTLLGSVAILVAVVGAWIYFARPEKEIVTAVIAGSATILGSVSVVAVTQYNAKMREIREAHRLQKTEVYSEFSDLVFDIFAMNRVTSKPDLSETEKAALVAKMQSDLQDKYMSFSKRLLLWGAPVVAKAWTEFKEQAQAQEASEGDESPMKILLFMDDVFREIRTDLDLSNDGMGRGDLVRQFLQNPRDLDEVLDA